MADPEKKEKTKKFILRHAWDFVLLISLAVGTASFFIVRAVNENKTEDDALIATVYSNNEKMEILDSNGKNANPFVLSTIHEEQKYTVTGKHNSLVISVKYNAIRVESSQCPGQECVNEGWVSHPNHPIICAYNAIYIEVTSHSWEEIIIK